MDIRPLTRADRDWVERTIVERWGEPVVAGHEERKLKPSIPTVDANGLPIRDELHLELSLR